MADSSIKTIKHLGPYEVSEVDDDILGDVVYNQEIPVIIRQKVGGRGKYRYAVLARDKQVMITCAGCFKRDMLITDSSRCKKCSSFTKHWDMKSGERVAKCKETGDGDCLKVELIADTCNPVVLTSEGSCSSAGNGLDLDKVSDDAILELVAKREIQEKVLGQMTDDEVAVYCQEKRKIDLLFDARPTRLIHELRRQHLKDSGEACNDTDAVGADIIIPPKVKGRTRKRKAEESVKIIRYAPRAATDMDVVSTDNFSNEFK